VFFFFKETSINYYELRSIHTASPQRRTHARPVKTNVAKSSRRKDMHPPSYAMPCLPNPKSSSVCVVLVVVVVVARQYCVKCHQTLPPNLPFLPAMLQSPFVYISRSSSILHALEFSPKIVFIQISILNLFCHFALTFSCFLGIFEL